MNIVVAGTGYVGLVTGVCLANVGNKVTCIDIDDEKIKMLEKGISPIYEQDIEELMQANAKSGNLSYTTDYRTAYQTADIVMIAVGTPERSDGSANLSYVREVGKQVAENIEKDVLIVVKSTVPIGTNDELEQYMKQYLKHSVHIEVASNPEFLAQGTAVKDTLEASRIVLGVESEWAEARLKKIYTRFNQPFVVTNRRSAEMIKYASNDFLALKISFMNDISNLCELVGANVEDVAGGMSYDARIGSQFLRPGIGYGGSCFPKDTKSLHWLANDHDYELKTIKAAIEVNEKQKLKLVRKAKARLGDFKGKNVAILGLTFKPETDDMREAPSIVNIQYLLEREANICAYDPVGIEQAKKIFKEDITYTTSIETALLNADVCFIMTEWSDIKLYDLDNYCRLMKEPLVYDGRNCYTLSNVEKSAIEYYSIGR